MSKAMQIKQLELNVDKSGVIIFGKKKKVLELKKTIEDEKLLSIAGLEVKVKMSDKYLGDYLDSGGLAKSVEMTVAKRYGICLNEILELKSVIEDFRMHSLGGIRVGIEIFNLSILPKLLYNADTWFEMNAKTLKRLENLQNILLRCLLSVPNSTPIAGLHWDCGMISMEYRVYQKKIMFIHYLVYLDDESLAKEIFCTQREYNLPGFVKEGRTLLKLFNLPNIIDEDVTFSQYQWKSLVKKAIKSKYEEVLKSTIVQSTKLKSGPMANENFEERDYLKNMSMFDSRTLFRIRSHTTNVRMNQRTDKMNSKKLWKCSECGNIDSQSHILWCPFHANLREGKSLEIDADLVQYFQKVLTIREERRLSESEL